MRRVAAEIQRDPPAAGYGALASGADILCAEALLAAGAELHAVLPFAIDDFIDTSVADSGAQWVTRFHRCLDAAASVTVATDDTSHDNDTLYRYGSELAMGLALLRAGCAARRVVGFDVVEVAPVPHSTVSEYTLAKLSYKLIGLVACGGAGR